MNKKIRTAWFNRPEKKGEVNNLPSLTVPGQAYSVEELFRRHAAGLPLGGERVPVYSENPEDDDLPDFKRMDLAEIEEYRDMLNQQIMEGRKKLHDAKIQARNKKREQEIQEAIKAREAKQKKAEQGSNVQRTTGSESSSENE